MAVFLVIVDEGVSLGKFIAKLYTEQGWNDLYVKYSLKIKLLGSFTLLIFTDINIWTKQLLFAWEIYTYYFGCEEKIHKRIWVNLWTNKN